MTGREIIRIFTKILPSESLDLEVFYLDKENNTLIPLSGLGLHRLHIDSDKFIVAFAHETEEERERTRNVQWFANTGNEVPPEDL